MKNSTKNSWCQPNLLITKLWIRFFVGKVNVMPLEAIDQKIEEFRTLSGDELKQAISPLPIKQPTLNKKSLKSEKRILSGLKNLGNMRFVI